MRLMKSAFRHRYMIMGGWGTGLYPRDASMRYWGGEAGGQVDNPGEVQEVQLQEYRGWSRGARDLGRAETMGEPIPRDRTFPCLWAEGHLRPSAKPRKTPHPRRAIASTFQQPRPSRPQQTSAESLKNCQTSASARTAASRPQGSAGLDSACRTNGRHAEVGSHDGRDDTGGATGVQLQHRNKLEDTVDHATVGHGVLSGGHVW